MPMTNAFRDFLTQITINEGSPVYFDEAHAHIGIGNSDADSGAASVRIQTDLQGTNKLRKPMTAGFPQRSDNQLVFNARFLENEANWDWREVGIFNDAVAGLMMCRFAINEGVKPSNQIWDYEVTITFAHGS